MNGALVVTQIVVQLPLMLVLPIALGAFFAKRFECGWKPWGAGAAAFVISQIVHLPLNGALGMLGAHRGLGLLPLPLLALAAGFTAGLCEEVSRYLVLRYGLEEARSFRSAVQFGLGHGGIEAILLGALVAISLVVVLVLHAVSPSALGMGPETAARVATALETQARTPWYHAAFGGLERVVAMAVHVSLSVMVMRAVVRRRIGWLLLAIGSHTGVDAFAVWSVKRMGMGVTEAGVAAVALVLAAAAWAMRDAVSSSEAAPTNLRA